MSLKKEIKSDFFRLTEDQELMQVCGFITQTYPNVIYFCDGAGLFLKKSQAVRFKRMRSHRGVSDLFILKPMGKYHGLIIELKRTGETIFKKNGELLSDQHIKEQARFLEQCEKEGYYSCFVIGYDEAKKIITQYLNGEL